MTSSRARTSRFAETIRIKPDVQAAARPRLRACARPDCPNEGTHPVPKSRERLNEYIWFCLDHARAHNETWDYFAGMSESQIEAFQNDAVVGHRPTWPLGKRSARVRHGYHQFEDSYAVFGDVAEKAAPSGPQRPLSRPQIVALEVLNLDAGATLHQIKTRYKELVKRFHPDANGGDRGAEERLKRVIQAYGVLRASGLA